MMYRIGTRFTDFPILTLILGNPKVHYLIPSQLNTVGILTLFTRFNIILPSIPRSAQYYLSFTFFCLNLCTHFSCPPCVAFLNRLVLLNLNILTLCAQVCKLWISSLCNFPSMRQNYRQKVFSVWLKTEKLMDCMTGVKPRRNLLKELVDHTSVLNYRYTEEEFVICMRDDIIIK
jgi:hypothetical protein